MNTVLSVVSASYQSVNNKRSKSDNSSSRVINEKICEFLLILIFSIFLVIFLSAFWYIESCLLLTILEFVVYEACEKLCRTKSTISLIVFCYFVLCLQERASLRHKGKSKFAKLAKRYGKFNDKIKDSLDEMRAKGVELMKKPVDDSESDEEGERGSCRVLVNPLLSQFFHTV